MRVNNAEPGPILIAAAAGVTPTNSFCIPPLIRKRERHAQAPCQVTNSRASSLRLEKGPAPGRSPSSDRAPSKADIYDIYHNFYSGGGDKMLNDINREEVLAHLIDRISEVLEIPEGRPWAPSAA